MHAVTDLHEMLDPAHTAVVTMECQRGVVGDLATFPALRDAVVEGETIAQVARVVTAARDAHVQVVHALAHFRADRRGSATNAPLLAHAASIPGQLVEGSDAARLVAELGPEPADLVSSRYHGVSPFGGTDLDALLRSCGVTTVVAVGVSLNVGVLGLCIEAVNLGYRAVVPLDATAAVPPDAARAIVRSTLSQLATITDTDTVVDAFGG